MSIYLTIALYLICWWIVLFAILPLRIGPQAAEDKPDPIADAAGAPHAANIKLKFVVTTIVSAVIFAAIYGAFALKLIKLGNLAIFRNAVS